MAKKIELSDGVNFALVDDEDYEMLSQYKWRPLKSKNNNYPYAISTDHRGSVLMHRLIMGLKSGDGTRVDHIDRDGLNNQRSNLRIVTNSQNLINSKMSVRNSSGYKGVSWHARNQQWQAYISVNDQRLWLGYYDTKAEAAVARDIAAKFLHGEFGLPNPPVNIVFNIEHLTLTTDSILADRATEIEREVADKISRLCVVK